MCQACGGTGVAADGAGLADKFLTEGARSLEYGQTEAFYQGLDQLIGPPSPFVEAAIEEEHCGSSNSDTVFLTNNYDLRTTPREEYWFVVDPEAGLSRVGRSAWPLEEKLRSQCRTDLLRVARPPSKFETERRRRCARRC